jgi:scyllo-inositol 2-dehydrogenase (NADP+)
MQKIKAAICSYGMSGKLFHAPFLSLYPGFELYGVWERSVKEAIKKYPDIKSFDTYEALLNDASIELVVINTPNYTHFDFAKKALQAGKHIVVEKPFCITVTECEELIELAAQKNKLLSVYQNRRYDSDYKIIKAVAEKNLIGDIVEAEFHFDRYRPERSAKAHKEGALPGSGLLYDLAPHLIDQTLCLFGMPQGIFADIAAMRTGSVVDDYFELLLFYPTKRVRLKASNLVREALPAYILHGTKGSFIKARTDVQEKALLDDMLPIGDDWGKEPENERGLLHTEQNGEIKKEWLAAPNGNYMEYYERVYQSLTTGAVASVTGEEGKKVIQVIEKAIESNREKKLITI